MRRCLPIKKLTSWIVLSLLAATTANGQSDTMLASWKHEDIAYTATLRSDSLIVRKVYRGHDVWEEDGVALSDINCAYLTAKPLGEPPTEILLNFLTGPKVGEGPKRVWQRNSGYPTPEYLNNMLDVLFDYSDEETALALANKVHYATADRVQNCE